MKPDQSAFENYIKNIIGTVPPESELAEILNVFRFMPLNKNSFLVEEGSICPYFCFIENGVLQHSIVLDGEEKTTYLGLRNSCTAALKSFRFKIKSRKSIKAITDCELWVIEIDEFEHLMTHNDTFQRFYHNLIENQIYRIDDYRIDLLTLSPEERYKKLLENEPNLLQDVPLHYLASFLGISTRHMSRIRKK
ncbi:MAG: Crp/Fnr family transcriptional regulator [Flavobacteriaceae bacterium]|nr:Crp/Fnr family transcriptional regulator [Flavobacteriaceae bacterium]